MVTVTVGKPAAKTPPPFTAAEKATIFESRKVDVCRPRRIGLLFAVFAASLLALGAMAAFMALLTSSWITLSFGDVPPGTVPASPNGPADLASPDEGGGASSSSSLMLTYRGRGGLFVNNDIMLGPLSYCVNGQCVARTDEAKFSVGRQCVWKLTTVRDPLSGNVSNAWRTVCVSAHLPLGYSASDCGRSADTTRIYFQVAIALLVIALVLAMLGCLAATSLLQSLIDPLAITVVHVRNNADALAAIAARGDDGPASCIASVELCIDNAAQAIDHKMRREARLSFTTWLTTLVALVAAAASVGFYIHATDRYLFCSTSTCDHFLRMYPVWLPGNVALRVPFTCGNSGGYAAQIGALVAIALAAVFLAALSCWTASSGRRAAMQSIREDLEAQKLHAASEVHRTTRRQSAYSATITPHGDAEYIDADFEAASDAEEFAALSAQRPASVRGANRGIPAVTATARTLAPPPQPPAHTPPSGRRSPQPPTQHQQPSGHRDAQGLAPDLDGMYRFQQQWVAAMLASERAELLLEREALERLALRNSEIIARRARFELPLQKLLRSHRLLRLHEYILECHFGPMHDVIVGEAMLRVHIERRERDSLAAAVRAYIENCDELHVYSPRSMRDYLSQSEKQNLAAAALDAKSAAAPSRSVRVAHDIPGAVTELLRDAETDELATRSRSGSRGRTVRGDLPTPSTWTHGLPAWALGPNLPSPPSSRPLSPASPQHAQVAPSSQPHLSSGSRLSWQRSSSPPLGSGGQQAPLRSASSTRPSAPRGYSVPSSISVSSDSETDDHVPPRAAHEGRGAPMSTTPPQSGSRRTFPPPYSPAGTTRGSGARKASNTLNDDVSDLFPVSMRISGPEAAARFDLLGSALRLNSYQPPAADDVSVGFASLAQRTSMEALLSRNNVSSQLLGTPSDATPTRLLAMNRSGAYSPVEGPGGADDSQLNVTIDPESALGSTARPSDASRARSSRLPPPELLNEGIERELRLLKAEARRSVSVAHQAAFFPGSFYTTSQRGGGNAGAAANGGGRRGGVGANDGLVRTPGKDRHALATAPQGAVDASWGAGSVNARLAALRR